MIVRILTLILIISFIFLLLGFQTSNPDGYSTKSKSERFSEEVKTLIDNDEQGLAVKKLVAAKNSCIKKKNGKRLLSISM